MLGGGVGGLVGVALDSDHTGDIDNGCLFSLSQQGQTFAAEDKRPSYIDGHALIPLLCSGLFQGTGHCDPGIINKDV